MFDAERYLRLRGEELIVRGRDGWGSPLTRAARALIAVGAIERERAAAVVDDYDSAFALREGEGFYRRRHLPHTPATGAAESLERSRIVPCARTLQHGGDTIEIRSAMLRQDASVLSVVWRRDSSTRARRPTRRSMMHLHHAGPPSYQFTDDRGTTATAHFSGGGSDEEWRGRLDTDRPLAVDTAWIEVNGDRVELLDDAAPAEVRVEPLMGENPGLRFLWHELATAGRWHHEEGGDSAVEALVAAGAVRKDDPVLAAMRRVRAALEGAARRKLPEPWASLLARDGKLDGRRGTLAACAVTPIFDGVCVSVCGLESDAEGFSVDVVVAPPIEHGPFDRGVDADQALAWWARDDRGNHYLGEVGDYGADERTSHGTVNYWPAIDPRATRLELMPTTERFRAVIVIPLEWPEAGS